MGIFAGPLYTLRALGLILKNPSLLRWALLPGFVTLVMSSLGLWACIAYGDTLVASIWPDPGQGWLHWIWSAVAGLFKLFSGVLVILITPWLVMLFGVPLCEPLSARIDAILGGKEVEGTVMASIVDAIKTTAVLSILGISGAIGFFIVGLIPGIGLIVAPFVALVWTPLFMAFNLYDSPMCRRQLGLGQKFRTVLGHPLRAISVGLVCAALISIPFINLLGLPIAVAAGVMAVRDIEERP